MGVTQSHFSTSIPLPTKITRHGKINFVDLAGSEMTKKTKSEGKTLEEANNINKSLMVTIMKSGFEINRVFVF